MKLGDYWLLIRDVATIVRTMARVRAGEDRVEPARYGPGCVRIAVDRIHSSRGAVRVVRERFESRDVKSLALAPLAGGLPPFTPGQRLLVHRLVDGLPMTSVALITSRPGRRDVIEITVKRSRRDPVSVKLVDDVHQGDHLSVSGPEGEWCSHPVRDTAEFVFITHDDGIIGFVSTIEQVLEERPNTRVLVLHGCRELDDLPFHGRLVSLAGRFRGRLRLRFFLARPVPGWSGERGLLSEEAVQRLAVDDCVGQKTFFLGGPDRMNERIRELLRSSGVRPSRIRLAQPLPPDDVSLLPGWPAGIGLDRVFTIHVPSSDRPIHAQAGEPLIRALERRAAPVRSACRSGVCGACRMRLTEGRVFTVPGVTLSPSDQAAGYIYACVSYPLSDLTVAGALEERCLTA